MSSGGSTSLHEPDLELIRALVNTREVDEAKDALTSPEALGEWLGEHGLRVDRPLAADDLDRAVRFREALRGLLLANNGRPLDAETLDALRTAARASPLQVELDDEGTASLEPARGAVEELTARVLATIVEAQATGSWERLKACPADDCQWAFYDRSRNRSRTWCSMEECGNRSKTRSYRARKGQGGDG